MSEDSHGYCIACPKCGAVQTRSYETNATMICNSCRHEFYAYLQKGLVIEIPADVLQNKDLENRMRAFALAANDAGLYPGKDPGAYQVMEPSGKYGIMTGKPDEKILKAIRSITERGNNAEVRQKKDGTLTVYEVKKNIAMK